MHCSSLTKSEFTRTVKLFFAEGNLMKDKTASRSNAASISLRAVAPDDEELLLQIYASTRADEINQVAWSDEQKSVFLRWQLEMQRRDYEARFPHADYDIILFKGRPAGRLWVARVEDQIRLLDIAILPEYQNRGIGAYLLQRLITESEKVGKPLRHWIFKSNTAARRFYERLGFRLIEDDRAYLFMEREPSGRSEPSPDATRSSD